MADTQRASGRDQAPQKAPLTERVKGKLMNILGSQDNDAPSSGADRASDTRLAGSTQVGRSIMCRSLQQHA
jgi:hypothetical protein